MAIKKLQNNYTTPEQSKRLLKLGVPADSADAYVSLGFENLIWIRNTKNELSEDFFNALINGKSANIPIWSVGRLMEIYDICRCYDGDWDEVCGKETYIETYVSAIEEAVLDDMLDFSKLEE